MKPILPAIVILATLPGLSACSQKTRDDTSNAAGDVAGDANATFQQAGQSVDNANGGVGNTGDSLSNSADRAGGSISNAADATGDTISNGASKAAHATGRALKKAGDKLDQ